MPAVICSNANSNGEGTTNAAHRVAIMWAKSAVLESKNERMTIGTNANGTIYTTISWRLILSASVARTIGTRVVRSIKSTCLASLKILGRKRLMYKNRSTISPATAIVSPPIVMSLLVDTLPMPSKFTLPPLFSRSS